MEKIKVKQESTKAKNKRFWALQKRDQRVAVARDVLAMIKVNKIKAERGTYVDIVEKDWGSFWGKVLSAKGEERLDEVIIKEGVSCTCCGIGSLFVGLVDMGDKVKVEDVMTKNWRLDEYETYINDDSMREKLRKVFSPDQIGLIETAFEKRQCFDHEYFLTPESIRLTRLATAFGRKYKKDETRLRAIMLNIIAHRGTFKP